MGCRQIFDKYSNTIFHENPSCGSRAVPCGRTGMAKLPVAFPNFTNPPANWKPYVLTSPRWFAKRRLVRLRGCGIKTDTQYQIRREHKTVQKEISLRQQVSAVLSRQTSLRHRNRRTSQPPEVSDLHEQATQPSYPRSSG